VCAGVPQKILIKKNKKMKTFSIFNSFSRVKWFVKVLVEQSWLVDNRII
jgi:hypothetical protein